MERRTIAIRLDKQSGDCPLDVFTNRLTAPVILYVTLGFGLTSLGSLLEGALFELFQLSIFHAGLVASLGDAAGLLSIHYALYGPAP